uniref:Uncharacterized protein n=1 Tax=Rhizophora mucronata TaxID=61149 RepID=A0A2P2ILI2_RHIMU
MLSGSISSCLTP